ncbi:uncharacterized protein KGF55_003704 [Candida pseudojiufengensis]|uniref:uncharacterized protein n=1 Tax=Candida pseudojiufengensis TaxID=497109 RepID=UPI0022248B70|nr:uncharacterized protein KGF55_003704 [Candida pseudojiufengensis]KAI5962628.1 hypothetical protein KGF55_003704 [Candida pseudojiufengensis]
MSNQPEKSVEESSSKLQSGLKKLSQWEGEMNQLEINLDIHRIKTTQPLYSKRREILKEIDKFWYIVLAENDDFTDYISPDDLKYLEYIDDLYINYPIANDSIKSRDISKTGGISNVKDFDLTIGFNENPYIAKQSITKKFYFVIGDDGNPSIRSESVSIQWPKELEKFNPQLIKEESKGKNMTSEQKKNYRIGMKSFFSFFSWTGLKPGKEFRNGEDMAWSIAFDLFVNAVKFYVVALSNSNDQDDDDDEEDSSEGEELDLSDLEPTENNDKRTLQEVEETKDNKKQKKS